MKWISGELSQELEVKDLFLAVHLFVFVKLLTLSEPQLSHLLSGEHFNFTFRGGKFMLSIISSFFL